MMALRILCVLLILVISPFCHGDDIQHLKLLDRLPDGVDTRFPQSLTIRTEYAGVVEFQPSDKFEILLNITAPLIEDAYLIQHEFVKFGESGLILQVFEGQPLPWISSITLTKVIMGIVVVAGVGTLITLIYAFWWYRQLKAHERVRESMGLLEGSNIQQPLMYPSSNSLQLATQSGETSLLADDDDRVGQQEMMLRNVHQIPEEEEEEEEDDDMDMDNLKPASSPRKSPVKAKPKTGDYDTEKVISVELPPKNQSSQMSNLEKNVSSPRKENEYIKQMGVPLKKQTNISRWNEGACNDERRPHDRAERPREVKFNAETSAINQLKRDIASDKPNAGANEKKLQEEVYNYPGQSMSTFLPSPRKENVYSNMPNSESDSFISGVTEQDKSADKSKSGRNIPSSLTGLISSSGQGGRSYKPAFDPSRSPTHTMSPMGILTSPMGVPTSPSRVTTSPTRVKLVSLEALSSPVLTSDGGYESLNKRGDNESTLIQHARRIAPKFGEPGYVASDRSLQRKTKTVRFSGTTPDRDAQPGYKNIVNTYSSNMKSTSEQTPLTDGKTDLNSPSTDIPVIDNGPDDDDFPSSYIPRLQRSPDKKPKQHLPTQQQSPVSHDTISIARSPSSDDNLARKPRLVTFQPQSSSTLTRGENSLSSPVDGTVTNGSDGGMPQGDGAVPDSGGRGGGGGGGGRAGTVGGSPMKSIHVAIVCSLCILGLATGVYCTITSETRVNIIVFAPPRFLSNYSAVLFSQENPGIVKAERVEVDVQWFVVKAPRLKIFNSTLCIDTTCSQGCDPNTGECICWKGFQKSPDGKCLDVDECLEGNTDCSPYASCRNIKGSYTCMCGQNYYGDGLTCQECSSPCPVGKFEVQSCSVAKNQKKICKGCTVTCHKGYFERLQCSPFHDTVCRMCQRQCSSSQYELSVCQGEQNRICKEKKDLSEPSTSENLILENRRELKDHEFIVTIDPRLGIPDNDSFYVDRGSNHSVLVKLVYLNIRPQFVPKKYNGTPESLFPPLPTIRSDYCPQPLPQYYRISYGLFKEITYRHKENCYSPRDCLSQFEPCHTYRQFGNFPNLQQWHSGENTLLCAEAGPLTWLFGLNREMIKTKSVPIEESSKCNKLHLTCDSCMRQCAQGMMSSSNECRIRGDAGDNGWSPRLQTCYNCCAKKLCMAQCKNYTQSPCLAERCMYGSVVEFNLEPAYPKADDRFYCSVEPVKDQLLLQLQYQLLHNGHSMGTKSVAVYANTDWLRDGHMTISEPPFDLELDNFVTFSPDLVHGDLLRNKFFAGNYATEGTQLSPTVKEALFVHSKEPFGIKDWARASCSHDVTHQMLKAKSRDHPYVRNQDIRAYFVKRQTFSITNTTKAPKFVLRLMQDSSDLSIIYPWTSVSYESLSGTLKHMNEEWLLSLSGYVTDCPGIFSLNISDGNYPSNPIFQHDVAVKCPRSFHLHYAIPTVDLPHVGRDFIITVKDKEQTIQLVIHKPEGIKRRKNVVRRETTPQDTADVTDDKIEENGATDQAKGSLSEDDQDKTLFSVPFVAAVCGAIILLLFLAIFGMLMNTGIPDASAISIFHWRHLVMMVVYLSTQFFYCVIVSMTTFTLLWIAVNSPAASFLQQYHQQTALQKALNSLELGRMQRHLLDEIERQTRVSNHTKSECDHEIQKIVMSLEEMNYGISRLRSKRSQWEKISSAIQAHTQQVLHNFTEELLHFRDDFNRYVEYEMQRLVFNVQQTYISLEENRWLAGPKFIHGTVKNLRHLHSADRDTKPLMEWLGLLSDFKAFSAGIDLSMPKPPLADITNFVPESILHLKERFVDKTPLDVTSPLPPIAHIYNLWFTEGVSQSSAPVYRSVNKEKMDEHHSSPSQAESKLPVSMGTVMCFFIAMALIDLIWLCHRMIKAYRVGMLMLYGFPLYVNYPEHSDDKSYNGACCSTAATPDDCGVMKIMKKAFGTQFIPKAVTAVVICLLVYVAMALTNGIVRKETLTAIGYYNDVNDLLNLNERIINSRIDVNAERINNVEYPAYQTILNSYIKRHLFLMEIQNMHSSALASSSSSRSASHKSFDPRSKPHVVEGHGCRFSDVQPVLFKRKSQAENLVMDKHTDPLIESVRKVMYDSSHLVLVYLAIVLLKQLTSLVIWLYVKRSGLVRMRVIYRSREEPVVQDTTQ